MDVLAITGYALTPGHFSTQNFEVVSNGGQLFALLKPVYYMAKDGRLFRLRRGGQSDGISAPQIVQGARPAGGNDWAAGWFHDAGYRCWLEIWNGTEWVLAKLSKSECDAFLFECAEVCGDSLVMAETLFWAVTVFGKRSYQG